MHTSLFWCGSFGSTDWVNDFFIEKAELFLPILNAQWDRAEEEAIYLKELLKSYGIKSGKVLETMCGNGRIIINLARLGYEGYGVDISETFIRDAEEKAREHGVNTKVKFYVWDARRISDPFPGEYFDAVLNIWTSIGYFEEKDDYILFREAYKLTYSP